jgi:hypothetical protein
MNLSRVVTRDVVCWIELSSGAPSRGIFLRSGFTP